MIRKLMFGLALAAGAGLTIGCEASKDTKKVADPLKSKEGVDKYKESMEKGIEKGIEKGTEKAKEVADKAGDVAKAAMEKAKTEFVTPIESLYPKFEEKIKGLTGDAGTKATTAFAAIKELIAKFKGAGAGEYTGMMGGITEKITELKKMLGL